MNDLAISQKGCDLFAHAVAIRQRHQRAHTDIFVIRQTNRGFGKPLGKRLNHRLLMRARHEDAADGGAFLPGLGCPSHWPPHG